MQDHNMDNFKNLFNNLHEQVSRLKDGVIFFRHECNTVKPR